MDDNTPDTTTGTTPPAGPKRLYRSREQRMFLGVCGGLGEYFDLDPTVVRLIFAAGVLVGGASIAVYAVLALIMPAQESIDLDPRAAAQETMNEASSEIQSFANDVVERVKGLFGRGSPPSGGN
jgi:phage shock protein C